MSIMKIKLLLLVILFSLPKNSLISQNLLVNGNFESGGNGTGFNVSGVGYTQIFAPFSGTTTAGQYALTANAPALNSTFIAGGDHTTGTGNMLIVDGTTATAGPPYFWEAGNTAGGTVCGLTVGRKYAFSYWIRSISNMVTNVATQADIRVNISNATGLAINAGNSTLAPMPNPAGGWQQVTYTFTASNACVHIGLWNSNTSLAGNDFAVDDFSLFLLPSATMTGNKTTCLNSTPEPPIRFTGSNGTAPYFFTYSINNVVQPVLQTVTGSSVNFPAPTNALGTFVYRLLSVTDSGTVPQTQTFPTPPEVTILVVNQLQATMTTTTPDVCANTPATLNFVGTPNISVFFSVPGISGHSVVLDALGNGTFITDPLANNTNFVLTRASTLPNGCSTILTGNVNIVVNKNGCATVTGEALNAGGAGTQICTPGETRTLDAEYADLRDTTSYTVSPIPFCPQAPFVLTGGVTMNDDDRWTAAFPFPSGFQFCYFGNLYTAATVGGNGMVSFDLSYASSPSGFTITQNIPNPAVKLNSIFGVFQDTDPSDSAPGYRITYGIEGQSPCRKFIVNYYNLGQFLCGTDNGVQTSQIVMYEVSNIIEVYVKSRTPCATWENGRGVIGIQNADGTLGYAAPGRNTFDPRWSATEEAWRFTPSGNSAVQFEWLENGAPFSPPRPGIVGDTTPSTVVSPSVTTTYTAQATYNYCGVEKKVSRTITIDVVDDLTGTPNDISEPCFSETNVTAEFNLAANTTHILGSLDASLYTIGYFTNPTDAAGMTNAIADPTRFLSAGQTIYLALEYLGCTLVKPFVLTVDCGVTPVTPPDQEKCDLAPIDGLADFDFGPLNTIVLGTNYAAAD